MRQFTRTTFRQVESFLRITAGFFGIERVPDSSTLSLKNRSRRFLSLLERFHGFVLGQLPRRKSIIATDATGFGNGKRPWRKTPHPMRAAGGRQWVKANCAVEVPQLLILSATLTSGRRSEAVTFEETWANLPGNVQPIRSLADAAYSGQPCVEIAVAHGATPYHDFPSNARHFAKPVLERERMVHFATHWPNRTARLRGRRALIETAFSKIKDVLGDRLRCRRWVARCNEALAKFAAHNVRVIVTREVIAGVPGFGLA